METTTNFDFDAQVHGQAQVQPETVTVDESGNVIGNSFQKEVSMQEAMVIGQILDQMGLSDKYEIATARGKSTVTLKDITDEELGRLQRKINIATWSRLTIRCAKAVTNFASDVADYALNGAIAPTAVAVADAALTTGRVVGTAAVKAGAGVAASAFRNGRAAVTEIWNSNEIRDCGNEMKACWAGISNKLFGAGGSTGGWTKTA